MEGRNRKIPKLDVSKAREINEQDRNLKSILTRE